MSEYKSWPLTVLSPQESKREQECPDRTRGQCRRINKAVGKTVQFPIDTCTLCWLAGPDTKQGENMRQRVITAVETPRPGPQIHRSISPCRVPEMLRKYGEVYVRKLVDEATVKSPEKVIVVGNGPSALKEKWGTFIDEWFDVVARVNKGAFVGDKIPFPEVGEVATLDYAEYVGKRIDVWATWGDWVPRFPCNTLYISTNKGVFLNHHKNLISKLPPDVKILGSRDEVMRVLMADLNRLVKGYGSNPSTGLQCVAHLLTKYERVHIIGFDHFAAFDKESGRGHHFYEPPEFSWKRGGEVKNPGHSPSEGKWFEEQERLGRVVRLENEEAWREYAKQ